MVLKTVKLCCKIQGYVSITRFFAPKQRLKMSFSEYDEPPPKNAGLFAAKDSAWDNIFQDVGKMTPLLPQQKAPPRGGGRQAMTAQEISAFDEMFNMIFDAVSEQSPNGKKAPAAAATAEISDLFGKLRRYGKKLQTSDPDAEDIDRKVEEIDLCNTDQQLLDWALREVFGASQQYEKAAREAMAAAAAAPKGSTIIPMPPLQPRWYGTVLARLMATFRDRFNDPHLALSVFENARRLSVPSYVFGCTTPAYNELIDTRWRYFRDVRGVVDALEEMRVNAIYPNEQTRTLVEAMRRDAGQTLVWRDDTSLENADVLALLDRAEQLSYPPRRPNRSSKPTQRNDKWGNRRWRSDMEWKKQNAAQRDARADDDYQFGYRDDEPMNSHPEEELTDGADNKVEKTFT
jgi:hypothetical protein